MPEEVKLSSLDSSFLCGWFGKTGSEQLGFLPTSPLSLCDDKPVDPVLLTIIDLDGPSASSFSYNSESGKCQRQFCLRTRESKLIDQHQDTTR